MNIIIPISGFVSVFFSPRVPLSFLPSAALHTLHLFLMGSSAAAVVVLLSLASPEYLYFPKPLSRKPMEET